MTEFDAKKTKDELVQWIRDWFEINGPGCNAVIGISGGKDSTIVAALCVEALGKDRVIGVLMPNGVQEDIDKAREVVKYLGIKYIETNIYDSVTAVIESIQYGIHDGYRIIEHPEDIYISDQTRINLPPRIRMATLYAIAQSMNGRVSCNSNLSERYIGYSTRWGDGVGDFAPLANFTVSEVKQIGYELGLPEDLIEKVPTDGLCGKTDEENLGFSYEVLDRYIREGVCEDAGVKAKIDTMHEKNLFKLNPVPTFSPWWAL